MPQGAKMLITSDYISSITDNIKGKLEDELATGIALNQAFDNVFGSGAYRTMMDSIWETFNPNL